MRAGAVRVTGVVATKPSVPVDAGTPVDVDRAGPVWVSRGADKLLAALAAFPGLEVAGRRCLDAGASTGGFTQVLLHHGAAEVVALDVGTDQLAPAVAADPRVLDRSGTTVRGLGPEAVGGRADVLVADLSFISLRLVLATLAGLLAEDGDAVLLVKPQFEVGRAGLGKRGVVRSAVHRREALLGVLDAAERAGLTPRGLAPSPLRGAEGNLEYLLWAGRGPARTTTWQALRMCAERLTTEGRHDLLR